MNDGKWGRMVHITHGNYLKANQPLKTGGGEQKTQLEEWGNHLASFR
jgi:hypothetical protein